MKSLLTTLLAVAISATTFANPIDQQKAKNIASQYLVPGHSMNLVKRAIRSGTHRVSALVAETAPYYVFSRGENQGYVIVAGDDCLPEILGYTESGNFNEANLPPTLKYMLEVWQNMVENAQANETNTPRDLSKAPALTATRESISPLTTSHWHQTGPYNDLCPKRDDNGAKSMTGCVATAISQILYYWRRDLPSTLQATTPTYGMDGYSHASVTQSIPRGTPLKWDLMLDSYNGAPAEYNEAVATMVYAVGTASHLEYSIESGTATSGHIEDIPKAISTYFGMNGGWVAYRSSYSQEAWTQLIYNELAKGRPVMYTGVHPSNGGHAVYIDGYQKNNDLMHFNFGWGGQSDGYYTTTLETGMNGFNDYQSCLIDAYPKKWNVKASIAAPAHTYANVDNTFRITVENNSTLDFSGLYCFISSSNSKPSSLTAAKSFDDATIIAKDGKGVVTLTAKPTSVKTWYVTITDENLNILAKEPVEVESPEARLTLDRIEVLGTSESEEAGDTRFTRIYNTKVMLNAYVKNTTNVPFGGTGKINLYTSTDNGASYNFVKSTSKSNISIPAKSEECVSFSITGLAAGELYYAEIDPEWGTSSSTTQVENTAVSRGYFTSSGSSDLSATLKDGVLSFTGHWDPSLYISLVGRNTYKSAIAYDLTKVESIGEVPEVDYPSVNALIYAGESARGTNVIANNVIQDNVMVTAGYDFHPLSDTPITGTAQFCINQKPACWYLTTVPFSVDVPDGILAREVNEHTTTSSGINRSTTNVTHLEGGKSYLLMTSSTHRQILMSTAQDNMLKATPSENKDSAFVGIYVSAEAPAGAKVIKDKEADKQYFMNAKGVMVEAMRGYFIDEKMSSSTTDFRAFSNTTLDPTYLDLAKRIQMLYDAQDEMAGIASQQADEAMQDSIANAERIFTSQSMTETSEVKKYYTALDSWIKEYKTMVENGGRTEVDMTALITNPSFETSTATARGWTQEKTGDAAIRRNSDLNYMTVGGEGSNYLYGKTGTAVTQTITLSPGYYRLTAMLGSEGENTITLFAGEKEVTVPAHAFGKHYLSEARIDDILVDETGQLTIGVKGSGWFNADDFKLAFTGKAETDAIVDIEQNSKSSARQEGIFNLQGTRVNRITSPGLYIINGKKTLVR